LRTIRRIIANGLCACTLASLACTAATAQADAALAAFEREDYAAALALYAPRAAAGDREAQYRMGMMARFGWGMDKDPVAAARWLGEAARQNQPQAQAELGTMYRLGRGVPEDPKRAAQLLTAAAAAGVGIAQLSIGRMYRDGVGVDRDLVEAYAWFTVAGDNGVMDGLAYRAEIASQMSSEQIAEGRKRAAQRGRKEAEAK
jgi:TPR repeat protein